MHKSYQGLLLQLILINLKCQQQVVRLILLFMRPILSFGMYLFFHLFSTSLVIETSPIINQGAPWNLDIMNNYHII